MRGHEGIGLRDGGLQALLVSLETRPLVLVRLGLLGLLSLLGQERRKRCLLDARKGLRFLGGQVLLPGHAAPRTSSHDHDERAGRDDLATVGRDFGTELRPEADELVGFLQLFAIEGACHRVRR